MGSLLNSVFERKPKVGSYSLGKQKKWHLVTDVTALPLPRAIGKAEKVDPSKFCHYDSSSIVIP